VRRAEDGFHVHFDGGDRVVVRGDKIALDRAPERRDVRRGMRVLARYRGGRFFPGRVEQVFPDGSFRIQFEGGDMGQAGLRDLRLILR
jgi:hypothetical protein